MRKEPFLLMAGGMAMALLLFIVCRGLRESTGLGLATNPTNAMGGAQFLELQAAGVSPVLFVALMVCACSALYRGQNDSERLLAALGVPVFLAGIVRAFFTPAPQDASSPMLAYAAPAYLTLVILLGGRLSAWLEHGPRRRLALGLTILGAIVPLGLYYYICEGPAFPRVLKTFKFVSPRWDPAFPGVGYESLAQTVEQKVAAWPRDAHAFVIAGDSDTASELRFFNEQALVFEVNELPPTLRGLNAIVVVRGYATNLDERIARRFKTVGMADYQAVLNRGVNYGGFTLFRCEEYIQEN